MNRSKINFLIIMGYFLVALLLLPHTIRLSQNILTSFESLLPHSLESAKDYLAVKDKLRSYRDLKIVIETQTPDQTEKFIDLLAQELPKQLPIDRIHYQIKSLQDYAAKYKSYYFPLETFKENFEKSNPVSLKSLGDIFHALTKPFSPSEEKVKLLILNKIQNFPKGYLTDAQRQKYLIVLYPQENLSIQNANEFIQKVQRICDETSQKIDGNDQNYRISGSLQSFAQEGAHTQNEFLLSLGFALIAIISVLYLFLRQIKLVFAILFSTLLGTYIAYGFLALFISSLTTNDIFLACFILGNGINTCIYYAFHYCATHSLKLSHNLLKVTLISALCHALCYVSFLLTRFDSLYHFALLGFCGMMICWLCGITFFPALITLLKIPPSKIQSLSLGDFNKKPKILFFFMLTLCFFSVTILAQKGAFTLESDLTKLESKQSKKNKDDKSSLYPNTLSPSIAILSSDNVSRNNLLRDLEKDIALKKFFPFKTMIFENILPDHLAEKQKYIKNYSIDHLKDNSFKKTLQNNHTSAPTIKDIPSLLKQHFSLKNGRFDTLISLNIAPLFFMSHLDEAHIFIKNLRKYTHAYQAKIFGNYLFWVDLREALDETLTQSFVFCIVLSLVIIMILAPSKTIKVTGLISLCLTLLFFLATLQFFHIHINFINFIGIPLSVSIGVDYVLNLAISQKEKTFPKEAVLTASLSTMIGYASLLLSNSNAIKSLGHITLTGEIVALCTAFIISSLVPFFFGSKTKN